MQPKLYLRIFVYGFIGAYALTRAICLVVGKPSACPPVGPVGE